MKTERKESGKGPQIMKENELEERKFSDQEGLCSGVGRQWRVWAWWGAMGPWRQRCLENESEEPR